MESKTRLLLPLLEQKSDSSLVLGPYDGMLLDCHTLDPCSGHLVIFPSLLSVKNWVCRLSDDLVDELQYTDHLDP